jgi:hypothetical protein
MKTPLEVESGVGIYPAVLAGWSGDTFHKGEPSHRAEQVGSPEGIRFDVLLEVAA